MPKTSLSLVPEKFALLVKNDNDLLFQSGKIGQDVVGGESHLIRKKPCHVLEIAKVCILCWNLGRKVSN